MRCGMLSRVKALFRWQRTVEHMSDWTGKLVDKSFQWEECCQFVRNQGRNIDVDRREKVVFT